MLKSFAHTGFVVSNLERSIAFYTEVIGLSLMRQSENSSEALAQVVGYTNVHVKIASLNLGNGHQLGLVEYVEPSSEHLNIEPKNICASHLAFFVEDIEDFYERKSLEGLSCVTPPIHFSMQGDNGYGSGKSFYAQDPDGNWLEFIENLMSET